MDDLVDLVGGQLEQFSLLVVVTGKLVSLLPLHDFLLEETLGIARSGGELDLVWIKLLFYLCIIISTILSLCLNPFINLLSDLGDGFGQLAQLLVSQPPVVYRRAREHLAECHMVKLDAQLWK